MKRVLLMCLLALFVAGCTAQHVGLDGQIVPGTWDKIQATLGLTPEGLAETGQALKELAPALPPPVGSVLWALGGVLGAGAVGLRTAKKKQGKMNDVALALHSVTKGIDALPPEIKAQIAAILKAQQVADGTRKTVNAVRDSGVQSVT